MIHVIDEYDMLPDSDGTYDFAITGCYMWLVAYLARIRNGTLYSPARNGVIKRRLGARGRPVALDDLCFSYEVVTRTPKM